MKNNWLLHFLRFSKIIKYFLSKLKDMFRKMLMKKAQCCLIICMPNSAPLCWPTCTISYKPACLLWPVHSPSKCYYFSQSKEVWENASLHQFFFPWCLVLLVYLGRWRGYGRWCSFGDRALYWVHYGLEALQSSFLAVSDLTHAPGFQRVHWRWLATDHWKHHTTHPVQYSCTLVSLRPGH